MVRRRQRERSLFEVLLPDGHKLWPDWLRRIDTLLEDEAVIEVVAQALETRWPESRRRGRPGTPAEVVIRMLILKHLFDWSFDDLEQEVPRIWSIARSRESTPTKCRMQKRS
jgi:IS5 family transposase